MRGALFDLDGTLLDVELREFLGRYFHALDEAVSPHFPGVDLIPSVLAATDAMQRPHLGATNQETFVRAFSGRTGVDLNEHWPIFDAFYRDVFPALGVGYGPVDGAREAIAAARALGWKVAIATQPIFPRAAIEHRLAWAGLSDMEFDLVTSYESMGACKPDPMYFHQVCAGIGCAPADCLMVGDDPVTDMGARGIRIRTFFVGTGSAQADGRGTMRDVPTLLRYLDASD
jgi:FMN phosphatase YigB (HAD superfamily)